DAEKLAVRPVLAEQRVSGRLAVDAQRAVGVVLAMEVARRSETVRRTVAARVAVGTVSAGTRGRAAVARRAGGAARRRTSGVGRSGVTRIGGTGVGHHRVAVSVGAHRIAAALRIVGGVVGGRIGGTGSVVHADRVGAGGVAPGRSVGMLPADLLARCYRGER